MSLSTRSYHNLDFELELSFYKTLSIDELMTNVSRPNLFWVLSGLRQGLAIAGEVSLQEPALTWFIQSWRMSHHKHTLNFAQFPVQKSFCRRVVFGILIPFHCGSLSSWVEQVWPWSQSHPWAQPGRRATLARAPWAWPCPPSWTWACRTRWTWASPQRGGGGREGWAQSWDGRTPPARNLTTDIWIRLTLGNVKGQRQQHFRLRKNEKHFDVMCTTCYTHKDIQIYTVQIYS